MPRVGLIGAGGIGNVHAASCLNLPDVTMTWIADLDKPRAEALAVASGARVTTDANELRERRQRGRGDRRHAYADAPRADRTGRPPRQARLLREANRPYGRRRPRDDRHLPAGRCRFMVGHVVRFFPGYARIKGLLEEGALGQVGVCARPASTPFQRPTARAMPTLRRAAGWS